MRREAGFVRGRPAVRQRRVAASCLAIILPNIMPIMIVQMSLTMGYAILNAAGLSFIGLGVRPPTPEWGIMVAEGARLHRVGRMVADRIFPGGALMVSVSLLHAARRRPARLARSDGAPEHAMTAPALLEIRDLTVEFSTRRGVVEAVQHVDHLGGEGRDAGDRRRDRARASRSPRSR